MASASFREDVGLASLSVLHSPTRQKIATMLDSRKILLSDLGSHRDWRGIAEQAGLVVPAIRSSKFSPMQHSLLLWSQNGGLIKDLWTALEKMDRYDVIDDTTHDIYEDYDKTTNGSLLPMSILPQTILDGPISLDEFDTNILTYDDKVNIKEGRGLQPYDALVLYIDEDIDFVDKMVENLEGEHNLKLCLIHRDLIGGLHFEYEAVVRLIKERCLRVVVVLSDEFLKSSVNQFFTRFAHALGIDQSRRMLIPCKVKPCKKPDVIEYCHSLDYFRSQDHNYYYWNYWKRLAESITTSRRSENSRITPDSIVEQHDSDSSAISSNQIARVSSAPPISRTSTAPSTNFLDKICPRRNSSDSKKESERESDSHLIDIEIKSLPNNLTSSLALDSTSLPTSLPSPPLKSPSPSPPPYVTSKSGVRSRIMKTFHKIKKRAKQPAF